jgi:hypothetical protein
LALVIVLRIGPHGLTISGDGLIETFGGERKVSTERQSFPRPTTATEAVDNLVRGLLARA